jgi:gentisate 1,2-dioxygenase
LALSLWRCVEPPVSPDWHDRKPRQRVDTGAWRFGCPAFLFGFSDAPVMKALSLYRIETRSS